MNGSSGHGQPVPVTYARLAATLATIVSVGFAAWAGVVYHTGESMKALVSHQNAMQATIIANQQHMQADITEAKLRLNQISMEFKLVMEKHKDDPWHDAAGNQIIKLMSDFQNHAHGRTPHRLSHGPLTRGRKTEEHSILEKETD